MIFKLEIFKSLVSTNIYLKNLVAESKANTDTRVAVLALSQSGGLGKLGSKWSSPEGNMYLSLSLKQGDYFSSLQDVSIISLLVGLAIKGLLIEYLGDKHSVNCKWANDVLVNGSKIAGILIEVEEDKSGVLYLIIGIGVNLNTAPESDRYKTASLYDFIQQKIDVIDFSKRLIENFTFLLEKLRNGEKNLLVSEWKKDAYLFKQKISISLGDERIEGIFEDIDQNGYLVFKNENGLRVISAGEIYNVE